MDFELKKTSKAIVTTDSQANTTTVEQGFTVGVVGCPYNMIVGDSITVVVQSSGSKTQDQIEGEVVTAVNAFIAQKYPNT